MTQLQQQVEQYLNQGKLDNVIEVCEQALEQDSKEIVAYHGLGVALQLKGQLEEAKQWYVKALEQEPTLAEVYVNLGSLYGQQKQWEKAIQAYKAAIKLQPDLAQAYRSLAKILYQREQPEQATDYAYKAVQLAPHSSTAQQCFQVGNQLWEFQKLQEAAICYKQAIQKQADFLAAHYNLAETWFRLQEWEKAETTYNQVLQLNSKFDRGYIGLGNILAAKEQWDEAIALYKKAIECNPDYSWTYNRLGNALTQKKCWNQAVKAYQQSIELNPGVAISYQKLGDIFLQQEKWQKAAEAYQKASELDSDSFWVYRNLGKALYQQGIALLRRQKCKAAIAAYSKAIQLNPNFGSNYYDLGLSLWHMEQWEDAVAAYIKAIQLEPDELIFIHHLGSILRDKPEISLESILKNDTLNTEYSSSVFVEIGQKMADFYYAQAAIVFYQLALKIIPDNQEVCDKLEQAQRMEQEINAQIQNAKASVIKHPDSFQHYKNLGAILLQKNYWNDSMKAYLKALELKPEIGSWYYERALWGLAENQKQLDRIIEVYSRAVLEKPGIISCHINLGKALSLHGRGKEAIDCYREAGRLKILSKCVRLRKRSNLNLRPVKSPDFIIIGSQKCGTTSLYHYLAQHPKIISSIIKEIHFWSRNFEQGLEWYLAQFPPLPQKQKMLTGEASPSYLDHYETPERLFQDFPDLKLIVLLRNPVDRAISHYHHWQREGWAYREFQAAVETEIKQLQNNEQDFWSQPNGYVSRGVYIKFIKKWMSIFPKEQFLIIQSEDFYKNPPQLLSQVYQFIGVSNQKLDSYKQYNSGSYSSIDPAIIEALKNYYKPYNAELEEFLGVKFNWDE